MGNKKKIGILTLHRALNFGAVWQCWALKIACERMGHAAETIDYTPFGLHTIRGSLHHKPLVVYSHIKCIIQFNRFVKYRLNPTQYTESYDWIMTNAPQDDIYIVGSDTVWCKSVVGSFMNYYLLNFAPDYVKRIAYAASTGGNPIEITKDQENELRKFSAISVREKQSVSSVQSFVKIPVADVCDPSLLLTEEQYQSVEQKPFWLPKQYIVYLDLAGDSLCEESVNILKKKLNLPIINLTGKHKRWARYNYLAPTPEQWLYILHHAAYVCTNSFHGVCFSIIYNRPFLCCAAQVGGRASTNGRVQNLLEQTHFSNRYITKVSQVTNELICETIDMGQNTKYVEAYRKRSLVWLKTAIENETNKE